MGKNSKKENAKKVLITDKRIVFQDEREDFAADSVTLNYNSIGAKKIKKVTSRKLNADDLKNGSPQIAKFKGDMKK